MRKQRNTANMRIIFEINGRYGYWHTLLARFRVKKLSVREANCNNKRYITVIQRERDGSRLQVTSWVPTLYVKNMNWERCSSPREDLVPQLRCGQGKSSAEEESLREQGQGSQRTTDMGEASREWDHGLFRERPPFLRWEISMSAWRDCRAVSFPPLIIMLTLSLCYHYMLDVRGTDSSSS